MVQMGSTRVVVEELFSRHNINGTALLATWNKEKKLQKAVPATEMEKKFQYYIWIIPSRQWLLKFRSRLGVCF